MHYNRPMSIQNEAIEYHSKLKAADLKLGPVLTSAQIDASTWSRWRNGKGARVEKWRAFTSAAETALAAKSASAANQSGQSSQGRAA